MTNKSENPREKLYRKMLHGHWVKIVSVLASVVVFITTYSLILPAITLSNQEPKCNIAEHTHVAECYDAEGNIVCGSEEHVHNLACYSDLNAAIESEEYWAAELPALTGDRNADVIAVAKSQIGYKENDENYKVVDNEQTKGYTRYGHWYGDEVDTYSEKFENGLSDYAYKDWDAMFVSFVLRYAEIYDMGFDSDAGNWAGALGDAAIYVDAANYVPQMGDLIFFTPNVGDNMRVGIVSGVNRGFFGNEIKSISVILGDSNNAVEEVKVAVSEYTEGDITFETIHGYGVLTPGYGEQPEAVAEQEAAVENADAAAPVEEVAPEGTDAAVPEGEAVAETPEAEVVPVSLEENSEHLIGQAEENLETVEEASDGETSVTLLDAGISEDGSEIAMNWNMTARLPEAMLPAGSIIRIDTSTGKAHAMTVGQVFDWAQVAGVGIDNAAYVDNDNFEVTFIGDNGLLYSWADVQNMDAATVTSFTGIHIKVLNDVELGEDGAIFFDFASKAKVSDANAGQNYYVSKVSVNGVSGAETYVYTNGEAETVDQNEVLRDAGLEEKPDEEPAEKTLIAKKSDYTVTMTYGSEAAIPDGAKLYVQEIRQGTEEYNRYIEDAKAALGISEEDAAELLGRFFDIKIMTKEGEFEPKAPVNVNIEYKKAVETEDVSAVSAVHFSEDGAETIPVETVDVSEPEDEMALVKSVEFSAESFSVYGVVYTVDFETEDGNRYNLSGGEDILLSELLDALNIDVNIADVADVTFTDYSLLRLEKVEEDTTIRRDLNVYTAPTFEEIESLEDDSVTYRDVEEIDKLVYANDWIITSLQPFSTYNELVVTLNDGSKHVIKVTDEAVTITNPVNITDIGTIHVSAANSVTNTEQERDASFDFKVSYLLSDAGIEALKTYIVMNDSIPDIVYDMSSTMNNSPVAGNFVGGTKDLMDNGKKIGDLIIDSTGKVTIKFTDKVWILRKSALGGNATVTVHTDANKIPDNDQYTYTFPGTADTVPVHYKGTTTTEAKKYTVTGDENSGYTFTYTAKFANTKNMDSLVFLDQMLGMQTEHIGSISVTGPGGSASGSLTWDNSRQRYTYDIGAAIGSGAGNYTVTYTTTVTAAQYANMKAGASSWEENTASWLVNGTKEVPGGKTSYEIKKPTPDVSVNKSSNKEDQVVNPGDQITYTVTFGDGNTSIADLQIIDRMTDLQTLVPGSMSMMIGGQSVSLPDGFIKYNDDGRYSQGDVEVFNYKFPENDTRRGPIVISYTTKIISQDQATANNIFEGVSVNNVGEEGWQHKQDRTTSTVTYDKEVIHTVTKGADAAVDAEGNWTAGEIITYTIKIGDGNTDLKNAHIVDYMTDLQTLVPGSVQIKYGDNGNYSPLTDGIVYVDDGNYSTNNVNVIDYVLPASAGYGPIYIQYQTQIVELTPEQQKEFKIYDKKQINNHVDVGKGNDGTSGDVIYPEEVKYPLEKKVTTKINQVTSINEEHVEPGDHITYHVTFGDETRTMDGVQVMDDIADIQKVVSPVTVSLSHPLENDITLQDGTVVPAGSLSFVMPTATGGYNADGVAWNAYFDDDKYSATSMVRVFYYTLPEGIGAGPVTITYDVDIINADEAKANGIMDTQAATNSATVDNNTKQTVVYPDFEPNVPHVPMMEKSFSEWDVANNRTWWDIRVDKTPESGFPLENVKVVEEVQNKTLIKYINAAGWAQEYAVKGSEIDVVNAVLTTESGVRLVQGVDYEVHKGSNNTSDAPYFLIYRVDEPITIHVGIATPYTITKGYYIKNVASLNGTDKPADATYDNDQPEIVKMGKYDKASGVIAWTVMINPGKAKIDPNTDHIWFDDDIPAGMKLVNFDYGYYRNGNTTFNLDDTKQEIHVWANTDNSLIEEDGGTPVAEPNNDVVNGTWSVNDKPSQNEMTIIGNHIHADVQWHIHPGSYKTYGEVPAEHGLNRTTYTITYYTVLEDGEWDRITSSVTGSLDYENNASVEYGGDEPLEASTKVTVTSEDFINKYDDTITGDYQEQDGPNHTGVILDSEGIPTNKLSYRIEVNPQAHILNNGNTLTLSDRIDTNMEFMPSSLEVWVYGTPGDEDTLTKLDTVNMTNLPAGFEDLVVSYNDDSRVLNISGIKDATAVRVIYKNIARAQGTDTFTNTATLTGGGSHSSTVEEEHKIETLAGDVQATDIEFTLRKIDENNVNKALGDVTFEVYQIALPTNVYDFTDNQWQQLIDDTNYVRANPGTPESAEKIAHFKELFGVDEEGLRGTKYDEGTTTLANYGELSFPNGSAMGPQEYTVYYWKEVENLNAGYKAEHDPHYFVLYPERGVWWEGTEIHSGTLPDREIRQKRAWALDDAFSYANDLTVASMASGVTWNVTNVEEKYTSITARKVWSGDNDNFYDSRPTEGITLDLYRKVEGGEWEKIDALSNISIQGSTYTDKNGKTVETWPNYSWYKLDRYADTEQTIPYYYKVVEHPVENYTTTYSVGEEGIDEGTVTVTNTFIPPTTNIRVHKSFSVEEGATLPQQVVIYLYRYSKNRETGEVTGPIDIGMSLALGNQNDWTGVFPNLPTRDNKGNDYSYFVTEDKDMLENAGFEYTVEYELDGEKDDEGHGLVSGTVEITNHGPGALKIQKNVSINGKEVEEGDSGADGTYTFHILKDGVEITDTYEDENHNQVPKSPVTITIENGVSNSVIVSDLTAGEYTIHEDVPDGFSITGGNDVTVKVIGGVDDPSEVGTAVFTNDTEKERVKVTKTWINANRDENGDQISGTNHDWPRGKSLTMTLYRTDGSNRIKVETDKDGNMITNPVVLTAAKQSHIFDDLAELDSGWSYIIEEDPVEGYDTNINPIDEDGVIEVINSEHTKLSFTKKWENTEWNRTDKVIYNREYLRIKVKLHRYYMNDGVLTETPYTPDEINQSFGKEIELEGKERPIPGEGWGGPEGLKETSSPGSDEWSLYWNDLPTVGVVDGVGAVEYIYKVEETMLYYRNDPEIPNSGSGINHINDDCWTVVDSEDGTTITNIYTDDSKKSVAFEKVWSDGNDRHNQDWVDIQLYRSKLSPGGYGQQFNGTIQVDTSNWLDTKGNPAEQPNGSVMVTVTDITKNEDVGTYELKKGEWTETFNGINGHEYSVVAVPKDESEIVKVAQSRSVITGEYPTVTIKGRVVAPTNTIKIKNSAITWMDPTIFSGTTDDPKVDILICLPGNHDLNDVANIEINVNNDATLVSRDQYKESIDHGTWEEVTAVFIHLIVDNINRDVDVLLTNPGNVDTNRFAITPLPDTSGGSTEDTFPEDTPVEYEPAIPADSDMELVPSADAGTDTAIALNKREDDNYSGVTYKGVKPEGPNNSIWEYSWAGLPAVDTTDGEQWYYYVKEMHYGSGKNPPTQVRETTYAYEYSEDGDMAVTKVIATNVVQGGKLKVKKKVTNNSPAIAKQTTYSFTVKDSEGKYVQNLEGDLGTRPVWFRFTDGETVEFPNLTPGTYTIEEDKTTIAGYELTVTITDDGEAQVAANRETEVEVENDYVEEKGSLKVAKLLNGLSYDNLSAEQKAALAKVTFTVKDSSNTTIAEFNLKVDTNDMEADLTKTIGDLKPGFYTVVEAVPNDSVPGGYIYKSTTVSVKDGTGTPDASGLSSTAQVVANQTVTVEFENTYELKKGSLKLKKVVTVNNGNATGSNLADGAYVFSVAGPTPATTVVKYVQVTVNGGIAESFKVADQNTAEAWEDAQSTTSEWAIVPNLVEGDYVITEIPPTGGAALVAAVRGDNNTGAVDPNNAVTVHVTYNADNPTAVPSDTSNAAATFTNNVSHLEVTKIWKDGEDANVAWVKNIQITLHKQPASGSATDYVYTVSEVINGETKTYPATCPTTGAPSATVTGNATDGYKITFANLDATCTYYVTEATVEDYKEPEYARLISGNLVAKSGNDETKEKALDGEYIINRPEESYTLPETGGFGTKPFYTIGIMLIAFAAGIFGVLKSKKLVAIRLGCDNGTKRGSNKRRGGGGL